jgi:hypothetical protein
VFIVKINLTEAINTIYKEYLPFLPPSYSMSKSVPYRQVH